MGLKCHSCLARQSPLCSVFSDQEISALYDRAQTVSVPAGSYLLHEEDTTKQVYNISSGALALERLASNGARQIMAFLYAGNFIGIASGSSYSVSGRALTDSTACQWRMSGMKALYQEFPKLEYRVHEIASRVVEATMDQLFVLGRKRTIEKIAWFLLFIEAKQSHVEDVSEGFVMPMTRIDIADYLGLVVETVSRGFSQLRAKGLIELSHKWRVNILDREGLARLGGYSDTSTADIK